MTPMNLSTKQKQIQTSGYQAGGKVGGQVPDLQEGKKTSFRSQGGKEAVKDVVMSVQRWSGWGEMRS